MPGSKDPLHYRYHSWNYDRPLYRYDSGEIPTADQQTSLEDGDRILKLFDLKIL